MAREHKIAEEQRVYEKRVEALRSETGPRTAKYEINHSEIFELDCPGFYYDVEVENENEDQEISSTKEILTPRKGAAGRESLLSACTPPKRVSSLPNSPTTTCMNLGLNMNTPIESPKTPKSVRFNDDVEVLDQARTTNSELNNNDGIARVALKGSIGFSLLSLYLVLLLLSTLSVPLLSILSSIGCYTELLLYYLFCFALDRKNYAMTWVCIAEVVVLALAALAAVTAVGFVLIWGGVVLLVMWWVWLVGMLFVEGSERFIEGWGVRMEGK